jgi:hypothetical protein
MSAKIPDSLIEITLKDILEGESVFTVPWCMYAEKDGSLFLNGNYSFYHEPHGTVSMKVTKKDGEYVVDISLCADHRWNPSGACFVGNFTPLPVDELIGYMK